MTIPVKMAWRQINYSNFSLKGRRFFSVAVVSLLFSLSGCFLSSSKIEFEKGQKAVETKNYSKALDHFEKLIKRNPQADLSLRAAKEGARVAYYDLSNYRRAVEFNRYVVLYSKSAKDREEAQQKIAEINFSNLQDYKQAILEYNRLLELPHSKEQELAYKMNVARSYFYLNNFFQALVEAENILTQFPKGVFDAMELKANVLMQTKRLDEAIEVLKEIIAKFPEQAKERQTGLVLTVVYEEKKDFAKAVETLESIKATYPNRAFIEERIKNLKERQSYLPGAKGWRK